VAKKKIRAEMFGVRFPDGTVRWDDGSGALRVNVRSDDQRAGFVEDRNRLLAEAGVRDDPGVVFLRRFRVIYFTEPEIV